MKYNRKLLCDIIRRVVQDSCFEEFKVLEKCFGLKYFDPISLFFIIIDFFFFLGNGETWFSSDLYS